MVWDGLRLFNPNLPNIDVEYPVSTKSPSSICGFYGVVHFQYTYNKIWENPFPALHTGHPILAVEHEELGSKSTDKLWKSPKTIRNHHHIRTHLGLTWDPVETVEVVFPKRLPPTQFVATTCLWWSLSSRDPFACYDAASLLVIDFENGDMVIMNGSFHNFQKMVFHIYVYVIIYVCMYVCVYIYIMHFPCCYMYVYIYIYIYIYSHLIP